MLGSVPRRIATAIVLASLVAGCPARKPQQPKTPQRLSAQGDNGEQEETDPERLKAPPPGYGNKIVRGETPAPLKARHTTRHTDSGHKDGCTSAESDPPDHEKKGCDQSRALSPSQSSQPEPAP